MEQIQTGITGLTIRFAEEKDTAVIWRFVRGLAKYEHLEEEMTATEEDFRINLFDRRYAEVLLAEIEGKLAGYALFFHSFSTFLGKPGIYLEDLFVDPSYRGRGVGSALLSYVAVLCRERGCGRLEWECLDWNAPSIALYERLGAEHLTAWRDYRLTGEKLQRLAELFGHGKS